MPLNPDIKTNCYTMYNMTDTGTVPILKEQIIIGSNTQIILLGMALLFILTLMMTIKPFQERYYFKF